MPLTKRKRDQDKRMVYVRMLQCVPTISERVACRIEEHFKSLPALQHALQDLNTFPEIRLDKRQRLGKTRLELLREYFCDANRIPGIRGKQSYHSDCQHSAIKVYPPGPRDNGEFYWKCALCNVDL